MNLTDSAGTPWAGRHFESNPSAADDGSAPVALMEALTAFREARVGISEVVDVIRVSRFLVPLLAELGETGITAAGLVVDKSQELSVVTVTAPDGRKVLPVFTSVESLRAWNTLARPIPIAADRIALAAASESTDLVIIDPTSPTEFVVRRPALWAIAQAQPWQPCFDDEVVLDAVTDGARSEPSVRSVAIAAGDPGATLAGAELLVRLSIAAGLSHDELTAVVERVQERWAFSEVIAARVDSLTVQLVSVP
jgi:hypothetical protein